MDTGRIKTFATESRKILKEGVMQRIRALGFDEQGRTPDVPVKVQGGTSYQGRMIENERFYDAWVALNEHIRRVGVRAVYEEAAYTWFNRLMAIRIMQKNSFIEPVLNYDDPAIRVPHIVSEARRGNNLCRLTDEEQKRLRRLLMDDTKTLEQFSILIVAYCRENRVISRCFGGIALYLELLLPEDILSQNRFIDLLNNTSDYITDEQFRSAELIGWLYQFYIAEKKDEVFASFKKGRKAEAEDIPAATQIFTPNWIVKYMVQNTVGRIYLDNNPYCPLKKDWQYLVEPSDSEGTPLPSRGGARGGVSYLQIDNLEDLTLADLACGSGHILVEGFDILYSLYIDEGYSRYDAVKKIFTKNLTGIDLDTRAKQLATFALLLKAAQIDSTFLDAEVMPRVYDMPNVDRYTWRDLGGHMASALKVRMDDKNTNKEIDNCFTLMEQAQNLGSIMKFDISESTRAYIIKCIEEQNRQHQFEEEFADLFHGFHIILALTEKYAALAMNPPYMGSGNMNTVLSDYVKDKYAEGKGDLCTAFMMMEAERVVERGFYANIVPPSWMFLSTFEGLRRKIIDNNSIQSLLHLSRGVFGADFGSVSSVIQNSKVENARGTYFRLIERTFQEFDQKHLKMLFEKTLANHDFKYIFANYTKAVEDIEYSDKGAKIYFPNVEQKNFEKIPGLPIGYWVSNTISDIIASPQTLDTEYECGSGLSTSDNNRFLRYLWEPSNKKIAQKGTDTDSKWFLFQKGGEFRKWYGNIEYVVNWENDGEEIKYWVTHNPSDPKTKSWSRRIFNTHLYLRKGLTWAVICSNNISFRLSSENTMISNAAGGIFGFEEDENKLYMLIAGLNSKIWIDIFKILNPTINYSSGIIQKGPIPRFSLGLSNIAKQNISISKQDWDAHETSWDFEENELIRMQGHCEEAGRNPHLMEDCYRCYTEEWTEKFNQLHENEEELNRQFIEIYGLEDELTPDVPLDEITILQQGEITIE